MMLKRGIAVLLLTLGISILGCNARDSETGTVTLQWQPPVENVDGSRLNDLAGYRVYWGPPERPFLNHIDIDSPETTSYVLEDLPNGEWRLGVSAITERDLESKLITAAVVIKDGEATWDAATLGQVMTRHEEYSAASRSEQDPKP